MANDKKQYRCAVYTRKSSEEGLEQDFNSLQAQREACEAFIISQRSEGWKLIPTAYDDGGLSGGNMERPALKRLMADIKAGGVDTIVVYKVDRLTRSLSDFAKMVDVFDAQGVSFVAVTQQFNTTTSMGRLTLNVLLSFAQFEREVTGERIRDKIAASKRKGIWMGGPLPLGYDVKERKLLIVPEEADRVRHIYKRYLALPTGVPELRKELKAEGIKSKKRGGLDGCNFSRGALRAILRNPIYIGKIVHKDERFEGQHEPIVDEALWSEVQAKMKHRATRPWLANRKTVPTPLVGKLFDEEGERLIAVHTKKHDRRYRYYANPRSDDDIVKKKPGWRLPATEFEQRIGQLSRDILSDRAGIIIAARDIGIEEKYLRDVLMAADVNTPWPDCIERIELGAEIKVRIVIPFDPPVKLEQSFPIQIKRRGVEMRMVIHGERQETIKPADPSLMKAIGRAMRWWEDLQSGAVKSLQEIAVKEGVKERYVQRLISLAMLAPDIVQVIASGLQPVELTTQTISLKTVLPLAWDKQRERLDFTNQ